MSRLGWGPEERPGAACRLAACGLIVHSSVRLLQSYLKGLQKMEGEPEHMSREQGKGLG